MRAHGSDLSAELVTPPQQFDVVWVITIKGYVKGLQTEGRDITWLLF